jgi:hypothetical protein
MGGVAGHDFWVLRDEQGRVCAELHGLATNRQTGKREPIGTNPDKYSLNIWKLDHTPPKYDNQLGRDRNDPTYIKNDQPHQTILRAGRQEVMDRWNAAVGAIEPLNAKNLDYPAWGIGGDTIVNSNSAYRTLGEVMGLPVRDFPGRMEPGINNRMASPAEIEQWRDPRYPVLTEPTIRPDSRDAQRHGALSPQADPAGDLDPDLQRILDAAHTGDQAKIDAAMRESAEAYWASPEGQVFAMDSHTLAQDMVAQQQAEAAARQQQEQQQANPQQSGPVMRM